MKANPGAHADKSRGAAKWLTQSLALLALLTFVVPSFDASGTLLKSQNLIPVLGASLLLLRAPQLRFPKGATTVLLLACVPTLIILQAIPTLLESLGIAAGYTLAGPDLNTIAKQVRDPLSAWLVLVLVIGHHRQFVGTSLARTVVAYASAAGAIALLLNFVVAPGWAAANYSNPRGFLAGFEGPNSLGAATALLIPFGLAWLISARRLQGRLLAATCLALLCALLMMSGSRGAIVALLGSFVIAVPLSAILGRRASLKRYVLVPSLAVVVLLAQFLAPSGPVTRLLRTDIGSLATDLSTARRVVQLRSALNIVLDRPLGGVGLGGFEAAYTAMNPGIARSTTPHNALLHVGAQAGLIGVFVLVAFYIALLALAIRAHTFTTNIWGVAAIGFPVNLVVLDLFFPYMFTHDVGTVVALLIGAVYAMTQWYPGTE